MQGLILAAGRGSRLGEKSSCLPKCLLEVDRRPLVEHQLEMLAEAGIGPVGMVLGYCADDIREVVGIRAEYISNPRWSVTNSLYSFWLAREWVKGPVLVLNSDLLFHPDVLDRLLAAKEDALAYDSTSGAGREHMKVHVVEGRLKAMSKDLPPHEVAGENLGVLCLGAEAAQALFSKAGDILAKGGEKLWLGAAVCELARERGIRAIDIAPLPWGEVDFPYDLDRLRKEVWPAIRRGRWKRRVGWRRACWVAGLAVVAAGVVAARAWLSTPVYAWETLNLELPRVTIQSGDRVQEWWALGKDEPATLRCTGPALLCIETRLFLLQDSTVPSPYVVEVKLDGKRLDWFKESGSPSETWRHPQWTVGKQQRINLKLPAGPHSLQVRLVASETDSCLLRARLESVEDSPE